MEMVMTQQKSDLAVSTLKQNFDASLRMIEAITEASLKIHETQLKVAAEVHASAEAARKQIENAADPQELWRIQSEWMNGSLEKSFGYWREIFDVAAHAQTHLVEVQPKGSSGRHAH